MTSPGRPLAFVAVSAPSLVNPPPSEPIQRLAAMGGTYGNLFALTACLEDAATLRVDRRAFLGDSIGCCGHSEEIVAMIRGAFDIVVAGNHEQQAAARSESCGCGYASPEDEAISCEAFRLATEALTDETRDFLGAWPDHSIVQMAGGKVLLCHGSPGFTSEFLYEAELDDLRLDAWLDRFGVVGFVCTHSGLPFIRRLRGGRFAVNCGAVGKADHDGDPAVHYALIEVPHGAPPVLELRRVTYDHEAWARQLEAAAIAPTFVAPIRTGVWTTGVASLPASERHRYLRELPAEVRGAEPERPAPPLLEASSVREVLAAFVALGLLSPAELTETLALFNADFPFFAAFRLADSLHLHVKVDDADALPRALIEALGTKAENAQPGYVKFPFAAGVNLIFSSIDVAEEDLVPDDVPPPKPFLDHLGIDLRKETGLVRAAFDDVPATARRAGWAHVPQGGISRPVYCCHSQVAGKHWVYPVGEDHRFTRPVELAYGPLVISGELSGCDLRPIDPRHPAAGSPLFCDPQARPSPARAPVAQP